MQRERDRRRARCDRAGLYSKGDHGGRLSLRDYHFAISTAGSCTLVLQTLILALLHTERASTIRISGGTHNAMALSVQLLQRAYIPQLVAMGTQVDIALERYGFYPAGGGVATVSVNPCPRLKPIELAKRGPLVRAYAEAFVAGIPSGVARRELEYVGAALDWGVSNCGRGYCRATKAG